MRNAKPSYQSLREAPHGGVRHSAQRDADFYPFHGGSGDSSQQSGLRGRLRNFWPFGRANEALPGVPSGDNTEASALAESGAQPSPNCGAQARLMVPSPIARDLQAVGERPSASSVSQDPVEGAWPSLATGDTGQRWMPDEKCTVCFHCGAAFSAFRRRHHCRLCGQIFCNSCSSNFVPGELIGRPREQRSRLCGVCSTKHCAGLQVSARSPREHANRGLNMLRQQRPTAVVSFGQRSDDLSGTHAATGASSSALPSAPALADEDDSDGPSELRSEGDLDGDTEDTIKEGFDGSDDFDESDEEPHIETWPSRGSSMQDRETRGDSDTDETSDTFLPKAPPIRHTEIGLPAAAWQDLASLAEFIEEPRGSVVGKKQEDAWSKIREEAFRFFAFSVRACCQHFGGGLEDHTVMLSICELARQVTDHIDPKVGDSMDILSYVKIKRIPGGSITDSQWVDGVIFSRDVAHRTMATCIAPCRLALLGDSLTFDGDDRLTSLDLLCKQEVTYNDLKVQKIADLQPVPDLLLCQGGVSQIAQQKLKDKNISLVLGVPPHILKAVERCTGAKVLPSVDSIVKFTAGGQCAVVGECKHFNVQHTGDVGSKPLAVVEGSKHNRCCTICLRGGGSSSESEALAFLTQAKRVLQWAIRLARHLQLESQLLFETWCEPRPVKAPTVPTTSDEGLDGERLDLVCYSVSKRDERTCSQPRMFRLPAYVSPKSEMDAPPSSNHNGLGWAGGLDVGPLTGVRDCTLHDWLKRCFEPDHHNTRRIDPQQAGCFPTPGPRFAAAGDVYTLEGRDLGASTSSSSSSRSGAHVHMGGGDHTSAQSKLSSNLSCGETHVREPPVPTKGEVLCFQHKRSRIVVELRDHDETWRGRTGSELVRGASTRWSLVGQHKDGETLSPNAIPPNFGRNGSKMSAATSAITQTRSQTDGRNFEVWRWCRCCKNHHVTPRNALSSSAGWLSFTKFLEMLLHNSTSKCSPLSSVTSEQCPHAAFRDHVLFFSSPHRPMVVGFKWEKVDVWQLEPPNLPLWDAKTRALEADPNPPDTDSQKQNERPEFENCEKLVRQLHDVGQMMDMFVACALAALSVADEEEFESRKSQRLVEKKIYSASTNFLCEVAANSTDSDSSPSRSLTKTPKIFSASTNHLSEVAANSADSEEKPCRSLTKNFPFSYNLPTWLRSWVWDSKNQWHHVIAHITELQAFIRRHLVIARKRLQSGSSSNSANEVDPVVVAFTQRDLLEAIGENGCRSSVRKAVTELQSLRRMREGPLLEDSSQMEEERRESSAFPLPHAISSLAEAARRRGAALLSTWAATAENMENVMGHAATEDESGVPDVELRHKRSKSQTRFRHRTSSVRSNSVESRSADRDGTTGRSLGGSNSYGSDMEMHSNLVCRLPQELHKLCAALENVTKEEAKLQQSCLERGIYKLTLPVHEDDVGSVIAHALLDCQVQKMMAAEWERIVKSPSCPCCPRANPGCCFFSLPPSVRSDGEFSSMQPSGHTVSDCSGLASSLVSGIPVSANESQYKADKLAANPWKRLPADHWFGSGAPQICGKQPWEEEWEHLGARSVLTAATSVSPIKLEFSDQGARYQVTIYHAPQFHIVRHWLCGDDLNFVRSLHRCNRITPTGGKSGAAFFVSNDRRFLLKAVNKHEFKLLTTQAEALFWYADQVLFDKLPSVLAQVVGVFTVAVMKRGRSKQFKRTFIVQRNLRYNLWSRPHSCFDLKGVVGKSRRVASGLPLPEDRQLEDDSVEPTLGVSGGIGLLEGNAIPENSIVSSAESNVRHSDVPAANKSVLWDQNFREWTEGKPLCLPQRDLKYLEAAVWNDTLLLSGQSLVDYSLLLAAAPPEGPDSASLSSHGALSVGIIDYLRPYTWDKQMETVFKSTLQHSSGQPTVIEPIDYSRRFRNAMGTFFVAESPSPT